MQDNIDNVYVLDSLEMLESSWSVHILVKHLGCNEKASFSCKERRFESSIDQKEILQGGRLQGLVVGCLTRHPITAPELKEMAILDFIHLCHAYECFSMLMVSLCSIMFYHDLLTEAAARCERPEEHDCPLKLTPTASMLLLICGKHARSYSCHTQWAKQNCIFILDNYNIL